jgi:hypothetical protein
MAGVIARDHAYNASTAAHSAAQIASADASNASPAGMPNAQKAAVAAVTAADAQKGVPVHAFDPDASPAEKAKLAGQAKAQLAAINPLAKRKKEAEKGISLGIDNSHRGGAPASTVTADDADAPVMAEGADGMPGGIPAGAASTVPPWVSAYTQARRDQRG